MSYLKKTMTVFHRNKILLFGSFVLLAFLGRGCAGDSNPTSSLVEVTTESSEKERNPNFSDTHSFEKVSEITRLALEKPCGSCHLSSLNTHKPAAIAFFDLDQGPRWHISLTKENLEGMAGRIKDRPSITVEQKEAIAVFLELKGSELKK
ncbi:hypothetical protein ACFQ1M_07550 [Sungkyunkwania multivorans]|uniref:Cytochrome c domain-containing protein n=1 Tax=Sungkyunkwania multivorans TaxID=1173618 RepID=A0ABW3CWN5_9FLAO